MKHLPKIAFILVFFYFLFEVYTLVDARYKERDTFENLETKPEYVDSQVRFLSQYSIPITIKRIEEGEKIDLIEPSLPEAEEAQKKSSIEVPQDLNLEGMELEVRNYVKKTPIIISKGSQITNKELDRGIVLNKETRNIKVKGISFFEAHSGYIKNNFFDKLAIYYENIDSDTRAIITTDKYILQYILEKKEIIKPGEKDLLEKDKYQIVLMTCYPRNTVEKRALFYFKLESINERSK